MLRCPRMAWRMTLNLLPSCACGALRSERLMVDSSEYFNQAPPSWLVDDHIVRRISPYGLVGAIWRAHARCAQLRRHARSVCDHHPPLSIQITRSARPVARTLSHYPRLVVHCFQYACAHAGERWVTWHALKPIADADQCVPVVSVAYLILGTLQVQTGDM